MRPCISIWGSVHPSVGPPVGPPVGPSPVFFKSRKLVNLTNLSKSDKSLCNSILVPSFGRIFVQTNLFLSLLSFSCFLLFYHFSHFFSPLLFGQWPCVSKTIMYGRFLIFHLHCSVAPANVLKVLFSARISKDTLRNSGDGTKSCASGSFFGIWIPYCTVCTETTKADFHHHLQNHGLPSDAPPNPSARRISRNKKGNSYHV